MAISREDALAALGDVQSVQARTMMARANRTGAPYLFLWGAIWIVGYTLTGLLPGREMGLIWPWLAGGGVVANWYMALRMRNRTDCDRPGWPAYRYTVSFLGVTGFVFATYWIMRPTLPAQYLVFPPILVAMIYILMGSFRGLRMMWVGVALLVLSVAGYAFLKPVLPYYLALVGGGGLILGGLWLRAA